jgi:isopenicillin-N synthase
MARWTNDVYQAANHRVKFMNLERISVPFFTEPSYNCSIESFSPDDVNATPLYPTITYGEWITERLQWLPEYRDIFSI